MAELNVAVVSAERSLWQGTAKSVVAKTPEGEIGILPGHEPVLAMLVEGPLRIEQTDGGKLLVAKDSVNVIAEVAELAEDIDLDRAKASLAAAQAAGAENEAAAIRRAETRINVASVAKGLR
jgi:F-type H+-transporting ATPase subunit epsilon